MRNPTGTGLAFLFREGDRHKRVPIQCKAAVLTYVVGSASGIKLLTKEVRSNRFLPWLSLVVTLVILPFIGPLLAVSAAVAALGFAYGHVVVRNSD